MTVYLSVGVFFSAYLLVIFFIGRRRAEKLVGQEKTKALKRRYSVLFGGLIGSWSVMFFMVWVQGQNKNIQISEAREFFGEKNFQLPILKVLPAADPFGYATLKSRWESEFIKHQGKEKLSLESAFHEYAFQFCKSYFRFAAENTLWEHFMAELSLLRELGKNSPEKIAKFFAPYTHGKLSMQEYDSLSSGKMHQEALSGIVRSGLKFEFKSSNLISMEYLKGFTKDYYSRFPRDLKVMERAATQLNETEKIEFGRVYLRFLESLSKLPKVEVVSIWRRLQTGTQIY